MKSVLLEDYYAYDKHQYFIKNIFTLAERWWGITETPAQY